jgi:hypothetical protein
MRLFNYLNESKASFQGTCDRFRQKPGGEDKCQEMMRTKKKIPESKFKNAVDWKEATDEGESWQEFTETMRHDPDSGFYQSANDYYFLQTAGFEFIWKV